MTREEQRTKRRELAIQHQEMRQKRKAEELANLPPEILNRVIKRGERHKDMHVEKLAPRRIRDARIPITSDIDVLILVRGQDFSNVAYLLAEALKSVGVKAIALVQQKPSGVYPQTAKNVRTVIEIRKYALKTKIIQFMHSDSVPVPLRGKHVVMYHGGTRYRQGSRKINEHFNPIVDKSIIQTRDLWDLGAKNKIWVLPPVDIKGLKPKFDSTGNKRIIAHYPHKSKYKGSSLVNGVIAKLAEDPDLRDKFEYRYEDEKVSWLDYLKKISKCDIYIEACAPLQNKAKYGEWGVTALEAAALGKVVVTHFLSQDEYPREYGPCSLIVANNAQEMEAALRRLILMDEDELRELKVKTRAWVEKYHSFEAVGKRLKEKVYGDWL